MFAPEQLSTTCVCKSSPVDETRICEESKRRGHSDEDEALVTQVRNRDQQRQRANHKASSLKKSSDSLRTGDDVADGAQSGRLDVGVAVPV
jgi:hypothetical protein